MDDTDCTYRDMLESKRLDVIQNLQVQRTFVFDYLRDKNVLDEEDCELIHSEKTTNLKIGKFVDILSRKGPDAYGYLLESLQLENPVLYEKLTGEQACATTSPIMTKLKNSYLGVGAPLGNGELEILTKHLERTYGDLHEMSRRFEEVVQRKKSIEDRLETTIFDLERNQEKVEHLQQQINSGKSSSSSNQGERWGKCVQYMETLRKGKSDRNIYIIALQTKLMSTKEELEESEKKNGSLLTKNEELQKVIDEIREDYKQKKCESMRLSERIQRQGDEIKKAVETMRKFRECQFQNIKLREERNTAQEGLRELHKWTEALKTRFDIVESENEKTLTIHTEIFADFGNVQDELVRCKEEMSDVQSVADDLRERVRHLGQDRAAYKKQRDAAFTTRREAILDRDKAFLERDQAVKKYNEMRASREARMDDVILQSTCYDEVVARNDVMEEEIQQLKMKLREKERDLDEVKHVQINSKTIVRQIAVDPEDGTLDENDGVALTVDQCLVDQGNVPPPTTLLLTSIKRRLNKVPSDICWTSLKCQQEMQEEFSRDLPARTDTGFPDLLMEAGLCREKPTRKPVRGRKANGMREKWDDGSPAGSETSTEEHEHPPTEESNVRKLGSETGSSESE